MKIGILGYGKEGKSTEKYFQKQGAEIKVFDNFTIDELKKLDFSEFDLTFRSPSVHPQAGWTSVTRYFFEHCPCPIIGVTGTKGKGTTCSLITDLLKNIGKNVYLVGNIGNPAIDILAQLTPEDAVVYELSSFQLWDLDRSPHVAVITNLEPDHLNVHDSYEDYVKAKANIAIHQTPNDYLIYHLGNPDIANIAKKSNSRHIGYPCASETGLDKLTSHLAIPGQHNRDNAEAALFAAACYLDLPIDEFIKKYHDAIITTFENFQGLPHRLQFLRELNHVKYYDDNFSSAYPALDVALATFSDQPIFLIAGGFDRGMDITPAQQRIFTAPRLQKVFLIGQTGSKLAAGQDSTRCQICNSLDEAFGAARNAAEAFTESSDQTAIVLMSPGAPSFDMFKDFNDRGQQFQTLVKGI